MKKEFERNEQTFTLEKLNTKQNSLMNDCKVPRGSYNSKWANMTWTGNAKFKPYPHVQHSFVLARYFVHTVVNRTTFYP